MTKRIFVSKCSLKIILGVFISTFLFTSFSNAEERSLVSDKLIQGAVKSIADDMLHDSDPSKTISIAVEGSVKKVLADEKFDEASANKIASDIASEVKNRLGYIKPLVDANNNLRIVKQEIWLKKFHDELNQWALGAEIDGWPANLPEIDATKVIVKNKIDTKLLEKIVSENTKLKPNDQISVSGKISKYTEDNPPYYVGDESVKKMATDDVAEIVSRKWNEKESKASMSEENYYRFYIGRSYAEKADGTWDEGTEWAFESHSIWGKDCLVYRDKCRVRVFTRFGKTSSGHLADDINNTQLISSSSGRTYIDLGVDFLPKNGFVNESFRPGIRIGAGATNLANDSPTLNAYYKKGYIGIIVPTEYGNEGYADLFLGYAYDNAWKEKEYNPNRIILDAQLTIPSIRLGKSSDALFRLLVNTPTRGTSPTDVSLSLLLRVDIEKLVE